jgi:uncharacterized membrane protein YvlD (DUF360 family)
MATSTFIHVLLWILSGLICAYGFSIDQFQQTLIAQYATRVIYIVLIVTGLLAVVHTVAMSPIVVWLHFILEIVTMGMFEVLLTGKKNKRTVQSKTIMLAICAFAITSLLGVVISYLYC